MLDSPRSGPRDASVVMELTSLGAVWPTKFSFSQSFIRHVARVGFRCEVAEKTLDDEGRGRIVYRAVIDGSTLTFVVFSDPLPEDQQQDRIIATKWDAWAALFVGVPREEDLAQSRAEIQKVIWGRAAPGTIAWSRANRSARLFEHVIDSLANGRQPDAAQLNQVGYLIRTTGFSGNGRNGMQDYAWLRAIDHPLQAPYHAQMLAAYLWREFGFDLAMHLARLRNPCAPDLSRDIRRFMGVGNSSGIGLVPFVVRHPRLLHRWIEVREKALAAFCDTAFGADAPACDRFAALLDQARNYMRYEPRGELDEFESGTRIAADLDLAKAAFARVRARWPERAMDHRANPVSASIGAVREAVTAESLELLNALALDVHEDGCADPNEMHADESLSFPPDLETGALLSLIRSRFNWVSRFTAPEQRPFFWYSSEENMEPRRGTRGLDEGEDYALPVDILGRLEALVAALEASASGEAVARFLVRNPDMRFMVGWAYTLADLDYSIARMDLLAADFSPLRIMRFQLASYGMLKFRPRSKTWLRATILQGAPVPEELTAGLTGDGLFPAIPGSGLIDPDAVIGE